MGIDWDDRWEESEIFPADNTIDGRHRLASKIDEGMPKTFPSNTSWALTLADIQGLDESKECNN